MRWPCLSLLLAATACAETAGIQTTGKNADGEVQLVLGTPAEAYMFGVSEGSKQASFRCKDDDQLVSEAPSVLAVTATGTRKTIDAGGASTDALVFQLEPRGLGYVTLSGTCDGSDTGSLRVRVVGSVAP